MRSGKRTQSVTAAKVHAPAITAHTAAGMLTSGYRRPRGSRGSRTASNAMNRAQAITTGDRTRARHVRVRCGGTISVTADDISGCGPKVLLLGGVRSGPIPVCCTTVRDGIESGQDLGVSVWATSG